MLFLAGKKFTKQMIDSLAPQHPVLLRAHPSYVINEAYIQAISKIYGKMDLKAAGIDEAGTGTHPASALLTLRFLMALCNVRVVYPTYCCPAL